jgi:hypothetical protein
MKDTFLLLEVFIQVSILHVTCSLSCCGIGRDLALIMDVARFKYPPHWVPVTTLFEAMKKIDPETGKSRGFYVMSRSDKVGLFCRIKAGEVLL